MKKPAFFLSAILFALVSILSYAQAPVPFINLPLVPDATAPGGSDFTLTVNGTGFVSSSVVNWNGTALATQFVTASQLTATISAADIAAASTGWITVVNPGGGASNTAFFTVTGNRGNTLAFTLGSSPGPGNSAVAVGDFNGDGKLDLALATPDNTVSVLLGDGTGTFMLASSPATGVDPSWIAVGDFNADGKADLAVTNYCGTDPNCQSPGTISILLGDGTGDFALASSPATGPRPTYVATGEFNGDGKLDLAVANYAGSQPWGQGTVSILMGDGTGNFSQVSTLIVDSLWPDSLAVGDFNQDGQLDLAMFGMSGPDFIAPIFLGDGTGNFNPGSTPEVDGWGYAIVAGDLNGDGRLDLVTADWFNPGKLSVLLGDGTGQFTLGPPISPGQTPQSLAAGDFNGDGKLDFAVVVGNDRTTNIMLGDGTGGFTLSASVGYMVYPGAVAVGDFNGDGMLDVATSDGYTNSVLVYLQIPVAPVVALSPTSLTFGTHLVGPSSAPQPVTLTNTGNASLDIQSIVASRNFGQQNDCGAQLMPGANCTIEVTFTPRQIGQINGTITITDNAPDGPQTILLSGVGTAVTLLPSRLNFGNVPVGTTSQPQIVTLTNYSVKDLHIFGVYLQGTNPGAFAQTNTCGRAVPPGGSCTISVTFTPRSKGPKTATGYVEDNGGASPQSVSLSGTGTK